MFKLILLCLFICCVNSNTVRVETDKGTIYGQRNEGYNTFLGVPYAEVDVDNPFGNSILYSNFSETPIYATDSSVSCPQARLHINSQLQCLRLNIYAPHSSLRTTNKIPILVWFHGGYFIHGSGGKYDGKHLVKHGIIVITVNYRLGPYGFMCLNERNQTGNQGLKDQINALRWVRHNIATFGGDPRKVTIAGQNYGAGGVELHLYSEYETLFDKAIVQSGSVLEKGFYVKPDPNAAISLAKHLGYAVTKTKDAIRVLANEVPNDVMAAAIKLSMPFSVCKEKYFKGVENFITRGPYHLNKLKQTNIMFGYTNMEHLHFYVHANFEGKKKSLYTDFEKTFTLKNNDLTFLSDTVTKFYFGETEIGPDSVLGLTEVSSDFRLNQCVEQSINMYMSLANNSAVYKYLFSYSGGSHYRNISASGASSGEELKYLFETETPLVGDEQIMIRNRMTTMWANFVKSGNPTPETSQLLPVIWTPVTGSSRPYLNIDVKMSMEDYAFNKRTALWDLLWYYNIENYVIPDV